MPYKKAHSRLFVAVVGSLCVLFISLAIAYSLVMRLYLRAYYCSAHAAALSIIPGLLLLSQLVFTCRLPVGCTPRSYWILLSVLNVLHFLAFATLAVCYSLVTRTPSFHLNYDYIAAFSWYYADVIITLSLIIVTSVEAARHHRGSFTLNQRNASGSATNGHSSMPNGEHLAQPRHRHSCCLCCGHVTCSSIFLLAHVLFLGIMGLSAYHAAMIKQDSQWSDTSSLYTVQFPGHQDLSLHLQCHGSGDTTVLVENDIGSTSSVSWNFLMKKVASSKVCVYDRRGYGWSEGYENDAINNLGKDSLAEDVTYLKQLLVNTNISIPFYYMGVGAGASYVTMMSVLYPTFIRGAIFVKAPAIDFVNSMTSYTEAIANFQPTGLPRVIVEGLVRSGYYISLNSLSSNDLWPLVSDFLRGSYPSATLANQKMLTENYITDSLKRQLSANKTVNIPLLVITDKENPFDPYLKYFATYNESIASSLTPAQLALHIDEFINDS